jgi:predicted CoA-binding protein
VGSCLGGKKIHDLSHIRHKVTQAKSKRNSPLRKSRIKNKSVLKKTVVVGATPNQSRYAYLAATMLAEYKNDTVLLGIRKGEINGNKILDIREKPKLEGVHTITLYIGPQRQPEWYSYLLSLQPKRIIFNPGTENEEFENLARQQGIETLEACTLVMLRSLQF